MTIKHVRGIQVSYIAHRKVRLTRGMLSRFLKSIFFIESTIFLLIRVVLFKVVLWLFVLIVEKAKCFCIYF